MVTLTLAHTHAIYITHTPTPLTIRVGEGDYRAGVDCHSVCTSYDPCDLTGHRAVIQTVNIQTLYQARACLRDCTGCGLALPCTGWGVGDEQEAFLLGGGPGNTYGSGRGWGAKHLHTR